MVRTVLEGLLTEAKFSGEKLTVIEGCARGADTWAHHFFDGCGVHASHREVEHEHFPADWETYGKAAGHIRNKLMLEAKPELVVAFSDHLETSKGTANMVRIAKKAKILVWVCSHA